MRTRGWIATQEEVCAVLEKHKGQFRRAVKQQLSEHHVITKVNEAPGFWYGIDLEELDGIIPMGQIECPWQVGDHLYVRETFQHCCPLWPGHWCGCGSKEMVAETHAVVYRADNPEGHLEMETEDWGMVILDVTHWRPSSTMPRWASRLMVEVTGVRIERRDEWEWVVEYERVEQ